MQENIIYRNFQDSVNKFGALTCLQFKQNQTFKTLNYKETEVLGLKIANFLVKHGVKPNDTICLIAELLPVANNIFGNKFLWRLRCAS